MNDFLKLDQAVAYVVRINNDPEFTADRILQDCADGRIPIYWRNSAQITTRLFDFTKTIPGTDSFGKWLELHPYDVAQFETAEQADILSFELTDQDMATLAKLNISAVDDAGNVAVYRHPIGGKGATVRRDQLHVNIQDLMAYAAMLAPPDAPAGTTASDPALGSPPPVDTEVASSDGPAKPKRTKPRTWRDVSETYLERTFIELQCPTVKDFFAALVRKTGADSPFDKGSSQNHGNLFARDVGAVVTIKMVEGFVTELRKKM